MTRRHRRPEHAGVDERAESLSPEQLIQRAYL